MENGGLKEIEKEYAVLQKKYSLPNLKQLDEDFDIACRIAEHETYTLLREIRKIILDKALSYLRFIELFINPSNAPMFFMFLIKNLDATDKKTIEEVYEKLGEFEIEAINVDTDYSEKNEAEFIKKIYKDWQEIKPKMNSLYVSLRKNWNQKSKRNNKSYTS